MDMSFGTAGTKIKSKGNKKAKSNGQVTLSTVDVIKQ